MSRFKFRAWYKPDFDTEDGPLEFEQKEIDGELFFVNGELQYDFQVPFLDDDWIVEQWTGLTDIDGNDVYEGDKVEFEYWVGDFAWEFMDEDERERQSSMQGKVYSGVVSVSRKPSINLELVVGDMDNTHMIFPIHYVCGGKVIGNIYENN